MWSKPKTTLRLVIVAIIVPSGVRQSYLANDLVDDKTLLEISVFWPQALVNIELVHRKWIGTKYKTVLKLTKLALWRFKRIEKGEKRKALMRCDLLFTLYFVLWFEHISRRNVTWLVKQVGKNGIC